MILDFEAARVARGLAQPRRFAVGDAVTIPSNIAVQTFYDDLGRLRQRAVPLRGTVIALLPPIAIDGRSSGWRYRVMVDFGAMVVAEDRIERETRIHYLPAGPDRPRPAA